MTDFDKIRPFDDFPPVQVAAPDTRVATFVPDGSVTNEKLTGDISPLKLRGIGAKVYNSASQTITTALQTAITFDTEVYDTGTFWTSTSNTRLTMPYDGVYQIDAYVEWQTSPTGSFRRMLLRLNGGGNLITQNSFPLTGIATHNAVGITQRFTKGDYIEMMVTHDRGADLSVNSGEANNFVAINFLFAV